MASKNPLEQMAAWLGGGPADPLAQLTNELHELLLINQTQAHSTQGNERAKTPSSGSVFGTIGKAVEGIFGSGLGLSPLLTGLMALFGGGDESEPPALVRFALPPAVSVNAGVSGGAPGIAFPVDYGQGSQVRPVAGGAPAQITVQVQAMDSRSFLDHSNEIAMAVRQAMLESSVLNDVIREA
ncbi:MAG: hypothetical protein DMG59_04230 [Acidobacteria bacterium]|nr:MAG: hypothetical protein DMG59_04230 [Acidobacteriota bacterium]